MLLGVDDSLGRILAALDRKGALNNTMVVFTSDHGYFYGEHGLNEERRLAYEETIRATAMPHAPWVVIPADDKKFARTVVAAAVIDALNGLDLAFPAVDDEQKREAQGILAKLG